MNNKEQIAFIKSLIGRKDIYLKQVGSSYVMANGKTTEKLIKSHISGEITIGTYPIYWWNNAARCSFIAIDIDAHVKPDDKLKEIIKQTHSDVFNHSHYLISKVNNKTSVVDINEKERLRKVIDILYSRSNTFFLCDKEYITVEETTGGFHIYISLPKSTLLKDAWLYLQIIKSKVLYYTKIRKSGKTIQKGLLKRDTEFYPTRSAEGLEMEAFKTVVGRGIKYPFAYDQKFNQKTKLIIYNGLNKLNIKPIVKKSKKIIYNFSYRNKSNPLNEELSSIIPPKIYDKKEINEKLKMIEKSPFLPYCVAKVMSGELKPEGSLGHLMRVCVANELLSYNFKPEVVAMAFQNQNDFDFDTSYKYAVYSQRQQKIKGSDLCCRCQTIIGYGFCLPECPRLGNSSNKLIEKKEISGVHSWKELDNIIGKTLKPKTGVKVIKKTTRSGSTTMVINKAIQMKKKILVVGPTKKIYDNTIMEAFEIGIKEEMYYTLPKSYRVKSNFDTCKLLKKDLSEEEIHKIKKIFPFVLKPQCKKCKEIENCSYQRFLRDIDSYDLIYITTAKLKAMVNSSESAFLLKELIDWSNCIFIDECSHLFTVNYDAKTILDAEEEEDHINKSFMAIDKFFAENQQYLTSEMFDIFMDFLIEIKKIVREKFIPEIGSKFVSFSNLNKRFEEYIMSSPNAWTRTYSLFFNYFKKTKLLSVKYLIWIFLALSSREVYLQQIVTLEGFRKIILASVDDINKLVFYIKKVSEEKLVVMTDALLPPIDLKEIYPSLEYVNVNDPNNSAKSQKVIIIKKVDPFFKVKGQYAPNKIENELIKFFENFAKDKALFMIVKSKKVDSFIMKILRENDIDVNTKDWYRGENTIGTKSDLRLMLVLGGPQPPSHVYDYIAHIYRKAGYLKDFDTDEEAGKYFENYSAKSAFIQGISRSKDPKGIEKSYVLIYGIPAVIVRNYLDVNVAMPEVEIFDKKKHKFLLE